MTQADFHRVQQLLRDAGFTIGDTWYSRESFGSWDVTVATTPRRRVLWDGKDEWLILQEETQERFAGNLIWRDLWIGKSPDELTCEAALEALRRHIGAA